MHVQKSISTTTPLVCGWSLTSRCNLRCCHCYSAAGRPRPGELTTEEALAVADKLHAAGVTAVNFGGGECALRPDFSIICRRLRELGMLLSYTSNGTVLPRLEGVLDLFHDIGVSIDFARAADHDTFRGRSGAFAAATQTLRALSARGICTEMVTCLTKRNCAPGELMQLYALALELGAGSWRLNRFRANGRGLQNEQSLALDPGALQQAFTVLSRWIPRDAIVCEPLFRAAFGGNCLQPGDPSACSAFRIQADGEVTPSVFVTASGGNVKTRSFAEIFASPVFSAARTRERRGKCRRCPAFDLCQGGDAGACYLAYGDYSGPDPLCWLKPEEVAAQSRIVPGAAWNVHERYLCTLYVPAGGPPAAAHRLPRTGASAITVYQGESYGCTPVA